MNFTLIALGALAVAGVANAADDYAPPPGLYRVDTVNGAATRTQQYQGEGPVTVCVKAPLKAVPAELVPAGACPSSAPVVRGGVATFKSSCEFGDITTTMRKVDAKTWESVTHTVQKSLTGAAEAGAATRGATISDSVMTSRMTRIADTCEAKR